MIDVRGATAVAIADGVRAGKWLARDVAEQYLDRIARLDGALGCYLLVDAEGARRRADAVDAARKAGRDPGALAGVPLGFKDIFCTRGIETTCASKVLRGFVPPYESTVTARLGAAGVEHEVHSGVSVYFRDPDGARIELIADPLGEMYGHQVL